MLLAAIFGVMGAAGLVFWLYKFDLDRARDAVIGGSQIVDTAAGPIEYAERGDGFPLLSIHGAGGGFDQGLANVADLEAGSFRVIAPSRFGYLRTPLPTDASAAAQADAHAALLSKLNVDKVVIVGVSAGARSAVELAIRHPSAVAALILLVPGIYSPTSPVSLASDRSSKFMVSLARAGGDFAWWAMRKLAPGMLVRFVGVPPALLSGSPKSERDRVMHIVNAIEPLSLRFLGINADGADHPRRLPLEEIAAPTLIISAQDDLFNTAPAARFAASRIPGAELIVFETGGHLFVGRGAEVRAAVHALLARADLTSPRRAAPAKVEEVNSRGAA
jgi:pimeloyl-ACP methyl ester carboxylesterase